MSPPRVSLCGMLLGGACLVAFPATAFAQGALTPPGAPAPTMKALNEIETRIAVQSLGGDAQAHYIISQPGSYYLTGDITAASGKSAIAINADGVTLDLGGHILTGVAGTLRGIEVRGSGRTQSVIRNGTIRNFDGGGVYAAASLNNSVIENLVITGGGSGIAVSGNTDGTRVRGCVINNVVGYGISIASVSGVVEHCAVANCSGSGTAVMGINAHTVSHCEVINTTAGGTAALYAIVGFHVNDCSVQGVVQIGTGQSTGINGFQTSDCEVVTVSAAASAATGILSNTVTDCQVSSVHVGSGSSAAVGISGSSVTNCRVHQVGIQVGSAGTPTGITGTAVTDCSVLLIGTSSSIAGTAGGISGTVVAGCNVQSVGSVSSAVGAFGISSITAKGCSVVTVSGGSSGNSLGITGSEISGCNVSAITLNAGTGSATGIAGESILDCRISVVGSGSSGNSLGIANYRQARNCTIGNVGNTGTGTAIGASTTLGGRTEALTISSGSLDTGIAVTSSHTVTNCTIATAVTGILVTGTRCVVDSNNLLGAHTTGIAITSGSGGANALVIRNQVRNSTANIVADSPAQVGPLVSATGTIATTNPWANFTD